MAHSQVQLSTGTTGSSSHRRGRGWSRLQLIALTLVLGTAFGVRPATAQLPDASGVAHGLGDNYTALARGRNAVAWNPAGLGMPDNPFFSLAIVPIRGVGAIGPIGAKDLAGNNDEPRSHADKLEWLERITAEGHQRGTAGLGLTYLSMNVGPVGLQISSSAEGVANIDPNAAELLLFGNAGRTGSTRPISLSTSSFDLAATSTAALSYGRPLDLIPGQTLAVGVTLKYTIGHVLYSGRNHGSRFLDDPLQAEISFPVIHTDTLMSNWNNGSGFGIDLGAAWESGPLAVGLTLRNLVNTFSWDESKLFYRPGSALVSVDSTDSDFTARSISGAPASITDRARQLADESRYRPELALGAAFDALPILTVVGEIRHQRGDVVNIRSATHAGVGAELRALPWIPLRGGVTKLPGGYQVSGGLGFEFGMVNLQLSAAHRDSDLGRGGAGMFVLSFGGN